MLRDALRALQTLRSQGHDGLRMSVNVSGQQFSHPDFAADLEAAHAAFGVARVYGGGAVVP